MKFELVNIKDLDKYLEKDNTIEVKFKEIESYANNLEGFRIWLFKMLLLYLVIMTTQEHSILIIM